MTAPGLDFTFPGFQLLALDSISDITYGQLRRIAEKGEHKEAGRGKRVRGIRGKNGRTR